MSDPILLFVLLLNAMIVLGLGYLLYHIYSNRYRKVKKLR